MAVKRIILEDGQPPQFDGQFTVGEVLQMADSLARWVQSLTVTAPLQELPTYDEMMQAAHREATGTIDDPLPTPPYSPAKVQNL